MDLPDADAKGDDYVKKARQYANRKIRPLERTNAKN